MSRLLCEEFDKDYEECSNVDQIVQDKILWHFKLYSEKSEELRCDRIEANVFARNYINAMA